MIDLTKEDVSVSIKAIQREEKRTFFCGNPTFVCSANVFTVPLAEAQRDADLAAQAKEVAIRDFNEAYAQSLVSSFSDINPDFFVTHVAFSDQSWITFCKEFNFNATGDNQGYIMDEAQTKKFQAQLLQPGFYTFVVLTGTHRVTAWRKALPLVRNREPSSEKQAALQAAIMRKLSCLSCVIHAGKQRSGLEFLRQVILYIHSYKFMIMRRLAPKTISRTPISCK